MVDLNVNVQLGHGYQVDSRKYMHTSMLFWRGSYFHELNAQQATSSLLCKSDTLLHAQLLRYRVIGVSE